MAWQEYAKCNGADTELFYPARDSTYNLRASQARDVCHGKPSAGDPRCPVIRECLLYALVMPDQHGVWGGMSSRERKTLHRRRDLPDYVTREDLERLGLLDGGEEELVEEVPGYAEEALEAPWPGGEDAPGEAATG